MSPKGVPAVTRAGRQRPRPTCPAGGHRSPFNVGNRRGLDGDRITPIGPSANALGPWDTFGQPGTSRSGLLRIEPETGAFILCERAREPGHDAAHLLGKLPRRIDDEQAAAVQTQAVG